MPLLLFEKYTWTTEETFAGEIKIAHYGAADIRDARVTWTVGDSAGPAVASGTLGPLTIKQGEVSSVGRIRVPLDQVKAPAAVAAPSPSREPRIGTVMTSGSIRRKSIRRTPKTSSSPTAWTRRRGSILSGGGKVLLFPGTTSSSTA